MSAPHPSDPPSTDRVRIAPKLDARELQVLRELAWVPGGAHRIWAGQPGRRCPWVPCDRGCCLLLPRPDQAAEPWLFFLAHEVLAPRTAAARARARVVGLTRTHRVEGEAMHEALSVWGSAGRTGARSSKRGEVVSPDDEGAGDGPEGE